MKLLKKMLLVAAVTAATGSAFAAQPSQQMEIEERPLSPDIDEIMGMEDSASSSSSSSVAMDVDQPQSQQNQPQSQLQPAVQQSELSVQPEQAQELTQLQLQNAVAQMEQGNAALQEQLSKKKAKNIRKGIDCAVLESELEDENEQNTTVVVASGTKRVEADLQATLANRDGMQTSLITLCQGAQAHGLPVCLECHGAMLTINPTMFLQNPQGGFAAVLQFLQPQVERTSQSSVLASHKKSRLDQSTQKRKNAGNGDQQLAKRSRLPAIGHDEQQEVRERLEREKQELERQETARRIRIEQDKRFALEARQAYEKEEQARLLRIQAERERRAQEERAKRNQTGKNSLQQISQDRQRLEALVLADAARLNAMQRELDACFPQQRQQQRPRVTFQLIPTVPGHLLQPRPAALQVPLIPADQAISRQPNVVFAGYDLNNFVLNQAGEVLWSGSADAVLRGQRVAVTAVITQEVLAAIKRALQAKQPVQPHFLEKMKDTICSYIQTKSKITCIHALWQIAVAMGSAELFRQCALAALQCGDSGFTLVAQQILSWVGFVASMVWGLNAVKRVANTYGSFMSKCAARLYAPVCWLAANVLGNTLMNQNRQ